MKSGKWLHGLVALTAAVLILLQQPASKRAEVRQVEMVPLARIGMEPPARLSLTEPPRRLAARPGMPLRRIPRPPESGPASPPPLRRPVDGAVAAVIATPAGTETVARGGSGAVIAAAAPVDQGEARVEPAMLPPVVQSHRRPGREADRTSERIHRDVVVLIKNYLAGLAPDEANRMQPLHLASAEQQTGVQKSLVAQPGGPGRWLAGLAAGPVRFSGAGPGMLTSGLGVDGFFGYRILPALELGGRIGFDRMEAGGGQAGALLLQAGAQARLFLYPRAGLSPILQAGMGYGQYRVNARAAEGRVAGSDKKSTLMAAVGTGFECRVTRRAGVQLLVEYERLQENAARLTEEGAARGSWSCMAGVTLSLSGPRIISRSAANGLAANAAAPK